MASLAELVRPRDVVRNHQTRAGAASLMIGGDGPDDRESVARDWEAQPPDLRPKIDEFPSSKEDA